MVLTALRKDLETMWPRVQQVIRQAKARVLGGNVHVAGKLVSVFEPSTEVIRKGKASKPTEFGKMVKVQEAENQIITHYEVFEKRPNDADLLLPAVRKHEEPNFGRDSRIQRVCSRPSLKFIQKRGSSRAQQGSEAVCGTPRRQSSNIATPLIDGPQ